MPSLKRLTAQQEWVALVAPPWLPYPPALARAGIDLSHLLVVQPDQPTEAAWATEQLLRSGGFRAVLAWLPRVSTTRLRRLQLAAEAGGDVWALVYRPESALGEASPAALRLHFSAATSPLHQHPDAAARRPRRRRRATAAARPCRPARTTPLGAQRQRRGPA